MSTPRIPPLSSKGDPDKAAPTAQHRKVEKIEKINAIDDEFSPKKNKFRQLVEAKDENPPSDLPSPFSLFSSSKEGSTPPALSIGETPSNDTGLEEEAAEAIVSDPTYSPSPSALLSGTVGEENENTALPRSNAFWANIDEPPDTVPSQPPMKETPRSSSRTFSAQQETQQGTGRGDSSSEKTDSADLHPLKSQSKKRDQGKNKSPKKKGLEPSPFNPPEKINLQKNQDLTSMTEDFESAESEGKELKGQNKNLGPKGVISPTEEGTQYVGLLPTEKKNREGGAPKDIERDERYLGPSAIEKIKKTESSSTPSRQVEKRSEQDAPLAQERLAQGLKEQSSQGKGEDKERGKEKKKSEGEDAQSMQLIGSLTTTPLPEAAITTANLAASAAAPYLGFEALAVYTHIVGSIVAFISPTGDSHTEFVLNAAGFANSKFYGSKVSIDRFSTAPYQLNIRLTGSNEAVNLFNQNIPNLLTAFQQGKFSFTINRIEAIYEKPLFRRKEAAGEKSDQGLGGSMDHKNR